MEYKKFSLRSLLGGLLCLALLLGGCAEGPSSSPQAKSASGLDASKIASDYLKLAGESSGLDALNYQLQATELLVQFGKIPEAQRILKGIHLSSELDPSVRRSILNTRLALLKNMPADAQILLQGLREKIEHNTTIPDFTANSARQSERIALLLPSKGPHAALAKIIQDGFLAGYYLRKDPKDPNAAHESSTLKVYDTGSGDKLQHAYEQALAEEADMIVGPLTKAEVQSVASMSLKVPVLALNTVMTRHTPPAKLYQFGLIPEHEAMAVSKHAYRQGHRHALVFYASSEWGQRLARAFKEDWKKHGADLVASQSFDSTKDLEAKLKSLMKMKDNQRRNDADMIFIAANVEQARQLKPLLNFYDAETLPVYATSSVYSGMNDPEQDQALNGVQFCDMPWVLQHSHQLQEAQQSIEKVWMQSANDSPRFFALGLDSYKLAKLLLKGLWPQQGFTGFTGDLTLNADRHIQRGLVCATFKKGIPVVGP